MRRRDAREGVDHKFSKCVLCPTIRNGKECHDQLSDCPFAHSWDDGFNEIFRMKQDAADDEKEMLKKLSKRLSVDDEAGTKNRKAVAKAQEGVADGAAAPEYWCKVENNDGSSTSEGKWIEIACSHPDKKPEHYVQVTDGFRHVLKGRVMEQLGDPIPKPTPCAVKFIEDRSSMHASEEDRAAMKRDVLRELKNLKTITDLGDRALYLNKILQWETIEVPGRVPIVYLALELCDFDLSQVMARAPGSKVISVFGKHGPTFDTRVQWCEQMASGLQTLHEYRGRDPHRQRDFIGMAHRDLKPANILLKKIDHNRFIIKISDFGHAKLIETQNKSRSIASASRVAQSRGKTGATHTDSWRATELVDETDDPTDEMWLKCDIFSLGLVFYNTLVRAQRLRESLDNEGWDLHPFGAIGAIGAIEQAIRQQDEPRLYGLVASWNVPPPEFDDDGGAAGGAAAGSAAGASNLGPTGSRKQWSKQTMLDRCARLNAASRLIKRMLLTNKQRPSAREVLQEMKKRLSPERGSAHLTKLISHWRQRVSDKQFNRKPLGFSVKGILDESGRTSYELRADDYRLCVPWQWTQTAHNPDGWMGAFADDEAQRIRRFATGGPHVMNCFQHNRFNDPENIIVLCRNLYEHVHEHERMPFLADVADMDEMERDVRGANIGAGTRLHHAKYKEAVSNLFASRFPELVDMMYHCVVNMSAIDGGGGDEG